MNSTGLSLDLVPAACMLPTGLPLPEDHADLFNIGSLQPDMVLVSLTLKKIGLLEVCSLSSQFLHHRPKLLQQESCTRTFDDTATLPGRRMAGGNTPMGSGHLRLVHNIISYTSAQISFHPQRQLD